MKVSTNKTHIELTPENPYDYFLLGRMSIAFSEHNYDFDRGEEIKTIKVFRITKKAIINRASKID